MRAMAGKQIVVRLAENDRTNPARWNQVAGAAGDAAGASGTVGVPAVPSAVLTEGLHLLANLDKDDLILLWAVDASSLIEALGKQIRAHGRRVDAREAATAARAIGLGVHAGVRRTVAIETFERPAPATAWRALNPAGHVSRAVSGDTDEIQYRRIG